MTWQGRARPRGCRPCNGAALVHVRKDAEVADRHRLGRIERLQLRHMADDEHVLRRLAEGGRGESRRPPGPIGRRCAQGQGGVRIGGRISASRRSLSKSSPLFERRPAVPNREFLLERPADPQDRAFVEEAAEKTDRMGHREARPVLRRRALLDARSRERQGARASRDCRKPERITSEGWPVKLVMISIGPTRQGPIMASTPSEGRVHVLHHATAQAIELDVVDGGEEARLAEGVGPCARLLPGKLVIPVRRA